MRRRCWVGSCPARSRHFALGSLWRLDPDPSRERKLDRPEGLDVGSAWCRGSEGPLTGVLHRSVARGCVVAFSSVHHLGTWRTRVCSCVPCTTSGALGCGVAGSLNWGSSRRARLSRSSVEEIESRSGDGTSSPPADVRVLVPERRCHESLRERQRLGHSGQSPSSLRSAVGSGPAVAEAALPGTSERSSPKPAGPTPLLPVPGQSSANCAACRSGVHIGMMMLQSRLQARLWGR